MDRTKRTPAKPNTPAPATLVLTRADIATLMTRADDLAAAEEAFIALAQGRALSPPPLHIPADGGGFHAKGARLQARDGKAYAALKLNGNFPGNPASRLPTIQGAILLSNAANGCLLAIMDSIEVTLRRTAAATVLAARYLATGDAATLTICGCGDQGRAQLEALAHDRKLNRVFAWDASAGARETFASEMSARLRLEILPTADLRDAARQSDVIVTCTTARAPFLSAEHVRPGTFIAAVGADSHDKSEIAPALMARGKVVVDVLDQCLAIGDLHHAVSAGVMTAQDVHATLADIASARKPGRTGDDEITLFDSTGTAVQDVAAAIRIYERAKAQNLGLSRRFGDAPTTDTELTYEACTD